MPKYELRAAVSLLALCVCSDVLAADPNSNTGGETCLTQQKDTFLNPFSKESAHHRPIGTDAEYTGDNDPATQAIQKTGFGNINSNNGWGVNVYKAEDSDPEKTVSIETFGWVKDANLGGDGLPVTIKIPQGADNAGKTDSVVVIVDGTTAHQFYQWRWNDGSPTAARHMTWKTDELGYDPNGKERLGTSASGVAGMFGLLRGYELNTPGCKINHTIQMAMSHNFKGCKVSQLGNEFVWPAVSTDRYCKDSPELCDGPIPYGGLLALPRTVNLDDLKLSEPGQRLAESLRDYGAYALDGTDCTILRADQDLNEDVRKQLNEDMQKLWTRLRMITNNKKEDEVAGGGEPCAENTAFDSPDQQHTATKCVGKEDNPPPDKIIPPKDGGAPPDNKISPQDTPPTDNAVPKDKPPASDQVDNQQVDTLDVVDPPVDPAANQQPDSNSNGDDLKEQITKWLWENLNRTKDGMETFKKWILEFFT